MAPRTRESDDKLSLDALQIKLEVALKRKGIIATVAVGMFFAASIIVSTTFRFIENSPQDSVSSLPILSLPSDSNIATPSSNFANILGVLPLMFGFFILVSTSQALLFGFWRHVSASRALSEDNENDIYEWVKQAYEIEKESVRKMLFHMHYVYASFACAIISMAVFVLAPILEPAMGEREVDLFGPIMIFSAFPIPVVLFAWYVSEVGVNDFIRNLNRIILTLATMALILIPIFPLAISYLEALFYMFVFFIAALVLTVLAFVATYVAFVLDRAKRKNISA